ncbi:MAG: patatin-like phospholipase family protein [Desulfobacterales bacterium]
MRKPFVFMMMVLMALSVFGGCGGRTCVAPTAAPATGQNWLDPSKIKEMKTHSGESLREAIMVAVSAAHPDQPEILVLSGGGQNGAFGAGFLSGLAQRADNRYDLNFDIVTGISTGALQATFAFLGPDYFDLLESFYSNLSQKDIFACRFCLSLLWSNSIVDSAPLRTRLEDTITLDMIEEVAEAHTAGRRLFIGTLDLDHGGLVVWDMGKIALGRNQQALEKYHEILMAATAVPVVLPPVELDYTLSTGQLYKGLHVDGGLRENLFFRHFMLDLGESVSANARLFVIVNGKIGLGYSCIDSHWVPIAKRTLNASFDETMFNGVLRTYLIACGNDMEFKLMRIPDDVEMEAYGYTFDNDLMQMLIEKGKELGQLDPVPWETSPPFEDDFVDICNKLRN